MWTAHQRAATADTMPATMLANTPSPLEALRALELEAAAPAPARHGGPVLGLALPDVEELLAAASERGDRLGGDVAARLGRGRLALERELARILAQ